MKFQERISLDEHEHVFLGALVKRCSGLKRTKVLSLMATAGLRAIEHEPENFGLPLRFKIAQAKKRRAS